MPTSNVTSHLRETREAQRVESKVSDARVSRADSLASAILPRPRGVSSNRSCPFRPRRFTIKGEFRDENARSREKKEEKERKSPTFVCGAIFRRSGESTSTLNTRLHRAFKETTGFKRKIRTGNAPRSETLCTSLADSAGVARARARVHFRRLQRFAKRGSHNGLVVHEAQ